MVIADTRTGTPRRTPRVLAGRYALDELVAVGGSSEVHRGRDLVLERPVAVKVLDVARVETADPNARRRFSREARTSASFTHHNAISVYDAGEDGDALYLVLEWVDGESLAHRLASGGPLPIHEAMRVATDLLAALDAAHASGIIHRDVKPANILLRSDGVTKLADFGIAQRFDDLSEVLTAVGTVVGTPRYLAPEQARGDALSPATDIYAVGVVLYEMLAGELPSIAGAAAPSEARMDADVLALRRTRADVPDHVVESIRHALQPEPTARHTTAAAMAASLTTDASPAPVVAPTAAVPAATAAVAPTSVVPPVAPATVRPGVTPATRVAMRPGPARRPGGWWRGVLVAAAAFLLVLVVIAIASGTGGPLDDATVSTVGADTTTIAPSTTVPRLPATLEELMTAVAANPTTFGPRSEDLVAGIQAVLAEDDTDDRAEVADALAAAVQEWSATGEIDQGIATIALQLLQPVQDPSDGERGDGGNGNGGNGRGNGGGNRGDDD